MGKTKNSPGSWASYKKALYPFVLGIVVYFLISAIVFCLGFFFYKLVPWLICLAYPIAGFFLGPILTLVFAWSRHRSSKQKPKNA